MATVPLNYNEWQMDNQYSLNTAEQIEQRPETADLERELSAHIEHTSTDATGMATESQADIVAAEIPIRDSVLDDSLNDNTPVDAEDTSKESSVTWHRNP